MHGRAPRSHFGFCARAAALALCATLVSPHAAAQGPADKRPPVSHAEARLSYAPLVKRTAPAVVNIYTKRTVRTLPSPLFNDPFFRRFFGDQFPGGGSERVQNSLGSGVIVDSKGVIYGAEVGPRALKRYVRK